MVTFVDASWLTGRLNDPGVALVDPRSPVKYLQGHIAGAVNLPVWKLVAKETLELLPEHQLTEIIGQAGIDEQTTVVTYDAYDGQNAAMVAWMLEYLGHPDVRLLSIFFDRWVREGHPVLYRPVQREPRTFRAKPNRQLRVGWQEVLGSRGAKLLDLRSEEEFRGEVRIEVRAGHLPGALNLPWTSLLGADNQCFRSRQEIEALVLVRGLRPSDTVITYCSYGPRAAIGYIALQQLGFNNARVYDGSFHEWANKSELPVQTNS